MKKKILGAVVALAVIVFGASVIATIPSGDTGNMTFTVENGQATLTAYTGTDVKINVPADYNGSPVTTISATAFDDENIERIYLPITVTTVETDAFINCGDQVHVVLELSDPLAKVPTDVANWGLGEYTARIREFQATGRADLFIAKGEIIEVEEYNTHECDAECSYIRDGRVYQLLKDEGLNGAGMMQYNISYTNDDKKVPLRAVDVSKDETQCVLMWIDGENIRFEFCGERLVMPESMASYFEPYSHDFEDMDDMYIFYDIQGLSYFDTSNVTDMSSAFISYGGKQLDLSSFNTDNVTNMSSMFSWIRYVEEYDLTHFNTDNVTDMSEMFYQTLYMKKLDISNFNTENVTNMSGMFRGTALEELDLTHFDTSQVTDMSNMFATSTDLVTLDVTSFDTSQVTNMHNMFGFLWDMTEIDLSKFNTSQVTNMSHMFWASDFIELDLSSFVINPDTVVTVMLTGTDNLQVVYTRTNAEKAILESSTVDKNSFTQVKVK